MLCVLGENPNISKVLLAKSVVVLVLEGWNRLFSADANWLFEGLKVGSLSSLLGLRWLLMWRTLRQNPQMEGEETGSRVWDRALLSALQTCSGKTGQLEL